MQTIPLGKSDLRVAPLAFGGNVFGWTVDEKTSFSLLDAFVAAGCNFIDTADMYANWVPGNHGGESETIIGKWLKRSGKRDRVVIATKVGMTMAPDKKGLSKRYIESAIEASLTRLQTDCIDVYYSHQDDPDTPMEETLDAYAGLVRQGKIRIIGASNFSGARLAEALDLSERNGLPRYECLQPEYNLYDRASFERELEPLCLSRGISVVPYFALASGFLSGKYRSEADLAQAKRGQMVKRYLNARGLRILDALEQAATELGVNPATIALAWLMARDAVAAPIASATTPEQLDALVAAIDLRLPAHTIDLLNRASAPETQE